MAVAATMIPPPIPRLERLPTRRAPQHHDRKATHRWSQMVGAADASECESGKPSTYSTKPPDHL